MATSSFAFFRGAVAIMAADLASHSNIGIYVQICGDTHVLNLGAYASFDGRLVFDINDFDETIRGPFEWDLKRMATSLLLAGRTAGIGRSIRESAVARFVAPTGSPFTKLLPCRCCNWRATKSTASKSDRRSGQS
jgi:uncharacterized protein (DUF2252 family)